jgi:hypothetical protein
MLFKIVIQKKLALIPLNNNRFAQIDSLANLFIGDKKDFVRLIEMVFWENCKVWTTYEIWKCFLSYIFNYSF